MTEKSNPDPITPMSLWRSFQEANIEAWSQGMAAMVATDAYSQAMRDFLDSYLMTSAPFRKILDQYMNFWLSSLNMPSREEISRLEQRLVTTEMRLNGLYSQLDQIVQATQRQTSSVMNLTSQHDEALKQVESHTHAVDSRLDTIVQLLDDTARRIETPSASQEPSTDPELAKTIDRVSAQAQELDTRTHQIAQVLQKHTTKVTTLATNQTDSFSRLDSQVQNLAAIIERMLQTVQNQGQDVTTLAQRSTEESARVAEQIQNFDTKTSELTNLVHTHLSKQSDTSGTDTQDTRISDMEARIQAIDNVTNQILQVLQNQVRHELDSSPDQSAEVAQLETRMQALDDKTGQVLQALQTLQTTLQTTSRTRKTSTGTTRKTTRKTSKEPSTEENKTEE